MRLINLYLQAYQHSVLLIQVCIYISMRLIRSQGILVTTVIRIIAAADTGRFERAEDGERAGVWGCTVNVIFDVAGC